MRSLLNISATELSAGAGRAGIPPAVLPELTQPPRSLREGAGSVRGPEISRLVATIKHTLLGEMLQ